MAITLNAEKRTKVGKYIAFDLRKDGRIPAVMYGQGLKENVHLSVNTKELHQLVKTGKRLLDLVVDGNSQMAVLKAVQHETIGNGIIHVDFRAINDNTMLHLEIEIVLKGDAKGLLTGGILEQNLHHITLECLPKNLPTHIELDVTELDIGKILFVSDLPKIAGVKYLTSTAIPVASCRIKSEEKPAVVETAEVAADATDAAATPADAKAGEAKDTKDAKGGKAADAKPAAKDKK